MPRVSIEIPADILAQLDETADEIFGSRSAALRLHWKQYKQLLSDSTSNMTGASKLDTGPHGSARVRTTLPQGHARARSIPEKKEEYKNSQNEVAAISTRVIGRINALRPKVKKAASFNPATYEPQVKALMKRGHTEMDMVTVVEWKADECKRQGSWGWFKPATLFRVQSFAEKLDEALAGVEVGDQQSMFKQPPTQRKSQDYSKRTPEDDPNDF